MTTDIKYVVDGLLVHVLSCFGGLI